MISIIRFIETITRSVGYTAALVVVPLALGVSYEVFARYFFGAPTIWAFELGYTLMGVHFLLGGALTLQRGAHVRIDLVYARLSPRMKALADLVLYITLLIPCLLLLSDRLIEYAVDAYYSGERSGNSAWNPVIWPFRAIIAVSFVLLLLQVVAECLKAIRIILGLPPTSSADVDEEVQS
jgi:TRAP-type mannitol/chloroaromatic compound transport system permease small subunit